jgi:hypothetical protein
MLDILTAPGFQHKIHSKNVHMVSAWHLSEAAYNSYTGTSLTAALFQPPGVCNQAFCTRLIFYRLTYCFVYNVITVYLIMTF